MSEDQDDLDPSPVPRGCSFCALVGAMVTMLLIYCALAWWLLGEPTPPILPDEHPVSSPVAD